MYNAEDLRSFHAVLTYDKSDNNQIKHRKILASDKVAIDETTCINSMAADPKE